LATVVALQAGLPGNAGAVTADPTATVPLMAALPWTFTNGVN